MREYIDDMVSAFAAADLIVSRAGATRGELMSAGKTAVMVPLPGQIEQRRKRRGVRAGRRRPHDLAGGLDGRTTRGRIAALVRDPQRSRAASRRPEARKPEAAAMIVGMIESLVS